MTRRLILQTRQKVGQDNDPQNPSAAKLFLGYSYTENPRLWIDASPLTYINSNTPPMLFINSSIHRFHTSRDEAIKILQASYIYFKAHTIPKTPNSFWLFEPWFDETITIVVNFLEEIFHH
jgi:pectinesterase